MFERIRIWAANRKRKKAAIRIAMDHFRLSRGIDPMGGYVILLDPREAIVRVMYMTDHQPPDRSWFRVTETAVEELQFDDVQSLEVPWR